MRWSARVTLAVTLLTTSSFGLAPGTGQVRIVNFVWKAPAGSSGQPIVSYKIYWGTWSGNYQYARELQPIPRASLVLARHITYYVAVAASDLFGQSKLSNEVIVSAEGTVTVIAKLDSQSAKSRK